MQQQLTSSPLNQVFHLKSQKFLVTEEIGSGLSARVYLGKALPSVSGEQTSLMAVKHDVVDHVAVKIIEPEFSKAF